MPTYQDVHPESAPETERRWGSTAPKQTASLLGQESMNEEMRIANLMTTQFIIRSHNENNSERCFATYR
jgi:hypothetical protein